MITDDSKEESTVKPKRMATVVDEGELRKQIVRMSTAWGWSISDVEKYLLRVGANRIMSLEKWHKETS